MLCGTCVAEEACAHCTQAMAARDGIQPQRYGDIRSRLMERSLQTTRGAIRRGWKRRVYVQRGAHRPHQVSASRSDRRWRYRRGCLFCLRDTAVLLSADASRAMSGACTGKGPQSLCWGRPADRQARAPPTPGSSTTHDGAPTAAYLGTARRSDATPDGSRKK